MKITYDYQCQSCGHSFEEWVEQEERYAPEAEPCPVCGEKQVKRAFIGAPSFANPASIGVKKPDGEFRNLLSKIKKDHRGSGNIDRYT